MNDQPVQKRSFGYLLKNVIGPAFLMVSTTVGAGSIVSAATSGAAFGYQMLWWILVIIAFNALYIVAAYKYTLTTGEDMLTAIRNHYGKPLAIASSVLLIIGFVIFSISNFGGFHTVFGEPVDSHELPGGQMPPQLLFLFADVNAGAWYLSPIILQMKFVFHISTNYTTMAARGQVCGR